MSLSKNEIRQLLSKVPDLEQQTDFSYNYLAEGITNENYWIKLNGREYVLRINNPSSDRLGLDREIEKKILKMVAANNLATESIYYGEDNHFRLSRWQPGTSWNKSDLEKQVNLNRLAQRLKLLHALPHQNIPKLDLLKRLELYRTVIQKRHGALPGIEQRLLPIAIKLLSGIQNTMPVSLCHNDLLAANILDTQIETTRCLCFLDWEYAAVIEPLFELAVICQGNQLSLSSQQYFLQAYLGNKAGQYIGSFADWCWFYDYLSLLWGLVILPDDLSLPDNLKQLIEKLYDSMPRR